MFIHSDTDIVKSGSEKNYVYTELIFLTQILILECLSEVGKTVDSGEKQPSLFTWEPKFDSDFRYNNVQLVRMTENDQNNTKTSD
jgi:hypothetical protein